MNIKPYHKHQQFLIPESHSVRLVSQVIDKIDSRPLIQACDEFGRSGYHLILMTKIMVFAYTTHTYSSRK